MHWVHVLPSSASHMLLQTPPGCPATLPARLAAAGAHLGQLLPPAGRGLNVSHWWALSHQAEV
jgi:hypothetical protein